MDENLLEDEYKWLESNIKDKDLRIITLLMSQFERFKVHEN